jgi:hypothetical protein
MPLFTFVLALLAVAIVLLNVARHYLRRVFGGSGKLLS